MDMSVQMHKNVFGWFVRTYHKNRYRFQRSKQTKYLRLGKQHKRMRRFALYVDNQDSIGHVGMNKVLNHIQVLHQSNFH